MIILPDLPYALDALEPAISRATLETHHGKHHAAYVKKTNALAEEAGLSSSSLEDIIGRARQSDNVKLFNNAAQAWNHAFYWQSMTPLSAPPSGALLAAINASFGNLDELKKKFLEKGEGHFASGWVWLLRERTGELRLWETHDAETIVGNPDEGRPLLLCDVWEHAYYLDRKNDRGAYLKAWFEQTANWTFAAQQLDAGGWRYPETAKAAA